MFLSKKPIKFFGTCSGQSLRRVSQIGIDPARRISWLRIAIWHSKCWIYGPLAQPGMIQKNCEGF
jgi:hypothetical protein